MAFLCRAKASNQTKFINTLNYNYTSVVTSRESIHRETSAKLRASLGVGESCMEDW